MFGWHSESSRELSGAKPEDGHMNCLHLQNISLEYTYDELSAATHNWHISRKLGAGSYASVYRGELKDGSLVAVKVLDLGAMGEAGQDPEMAGFDEEVVTLSKFRHPNLVTLLGWARHEKLRYLVYELLGGGDAFQRLQRSKGGQQSFHWHERLSVCLDAAMGLSHMHASKPKAFHRDIKSANILIDKHGTAKMADFGLSCTARQNEDLHKTVKNVSGTPGYACPIYSRTGRVTEGSEVYSFGMVMIELLTSLAPAERDLRVPGGIGFPVLLRIGPNRPGALERCLQEADANASWPAQLATEFATLALRSVAADDERQRPLFVELVRSLRKMTENFPSSGASMPSSIPVQVPKAQHHSRGGATPSHPSSAPKQSSNSAYPANSSPRKSPPKQIEVVVEVATQPKMHVQPRFWLEFITAKGVVLETVPPEIRRIPVHPGDPGASVLTVPVGRQHQPDTFDAWLPDINLRNRVSRTAFEISGNSTGGDPWLTAGGTNPISVDGKVADSGVRVPLWSGSEIGFVGGTSGSSASAFLLARFVFAGASPKAVVDTPLKAGLSVVRHQPSEEAGGLNLDDSAADPSSAQTQDFSVLANMHLMCIYAEGLTEDRLVALPKECRRFNLVEGCTLIGRQHQPKQFQNLLAEAPSKSLCKISRTHVEIQAQPPSCTNMSSNPICIDTEILAKGQSCALAKDRVLSFTKPAGNATAHILRLRVCTNEVDPCIVDSGVPAPIPNPKEPEQVEAHSAGCSAQIVLELCGTGLLDVPASSRCIGPTTLIPGGPLTVGRRHQLEFLKKIVKKEWLEFVSRDHFRVAINENGTLRLQVMTSNPLWHYTGLEPTQRLAQLGRGDDVVLDPGDCVIVDTAEEDPTVDDLRTKVLYWRVQLQDEATLSQKSPTPDKGSPRR